MAEPHQWTTANRVFGRRRAQHRMLGTSPGNAGILGARASRPHLRARGHVLQARHPRSRSVKGLPLHMVGVEKRGGRHGAFPLGLEARDAQQAIPGRHLDAGLAGPDDTARRR